MNCYSHKPFTVLGDGELLALADDERVWILRSPLLKNWSLRQQQDRVEITSWGSPRREFVPGRAWCDADLSVTADRVDTMPASDFDLSRNLIQRYTIYDLFKIINEKIEARKQPPGKGERVTTFG